MNQLNPAHCYYVKDHIDMVWIGFWLFVVMTAAQIVHHHITRPLFRHVARIVIENNVDSTSFGGTAGGKKA